MTVGELKKELEFYDDGMQISFDVFDEFVPDRVTEDRWGNRSVWINTTCKPTFIGEVGGVMQIELGKDEE